MNRPAHTIILTTHQDSLTGDELISDSYDLKLVGNGVAYEADCSMIKVGGETFGTRTVPSGLEPGVSHDSGPSLSRDFRSTRTNHV